MSSEMEYSLLITFGPYMATWEHPGVLKGDPELTFLLEQSLSPNGWGPVPSVHTYEAALAWQDAFRHLVAEMLPDAKVTEYGAGVTLDPEPEGAIY